MPLKIDMQRHSVKRRHLIRNERRSTRWGMGMFYTGKKGRQRAGKDRKKNKENGHSEQIHNASPHWFSANHGLEAVSDLMQLPSKSKIKSNPSRKTKL